MCRYAGAFIQADLIAQHQGYVKVNWTRLNKDMQQAKNELARRANSKLPRIVEE
ncbi:hypothetical protein IscW_ISCW019447, partial [Ixodes scapularis]